MGLFGKGRRRSTGRVLRAAGMRVDTASQQTLRNLALTKQDWQADAWGYRDMIGELRFAVQFVARAVARVKFMAAEVVPDDDEPIPLSSDKGVTIPAALRQAAQEEMERLPLDSGYVFLGILNENLKITGEAWLHGWEDEETGEERWEVLSVSEVLVGMDGMIHIRRYGEQVQTPVNPETEEMLRIWVPHPQFKALADSPMRALLGPCEDLVLAGREIRAASRSRFAANGMLLIPDGLTMLKGTQEDSIRGVEDDAFMADLTALMLAPISNEGEPGAVVPPVLTGNTEDLKAVRHVRMEREDSPTLLQKIDKALTRIARGLDIPPEIMTGVADANHWTAWQIDASTYRYHIDPDVRTVADSFTAAFLRPALRARGFSPEDVRRVQVWYDSGNITENPNRGQDAKDAWDRGAIGYDTFRKALGFSDADAPSDEEILRMVAFKIGVDPGTAGNLLQILFGSSQTQDAISVPSQRADEGQRQLPAGEDGQNEGGEGQVPPGAPDSGTPNTGPPQLSQGAQRLLSVLLADSAPADEEPRDEDWIVDTESGRRLMEIDRAERDRLLVAADAALARALEKAGARIKSRAQKNASLRHGITGMSGLEVARHLGREAALALGQDEEELLGDALDALREKFQRWTEAAIERAIAVVLTLLRLEPDSDAGERLAARLRESLSGRVGTAWDMLRDALMRLAERILFTADPGSENEPGEAPDSMVPPGLIRGVLSVIGGTPRETGGVDEDGNPARPDRPVGGIGLGQDVQDVLAENGVRELGFEWAYGITPVRHFEPHREMDGERFTSWADPRLVPPQQYAWVGPVFRPGDHKGCMCDYVPAYAIPERAELMAERLGEDSPGARDARMLAEADDAAGRTGTTAQAIRDETDRIRQLQARWIERGRGD